MVEQVKKYLDNLPISEKFKKDVAWNIGSLFILGIAGIAMNILIARFYGADTLGVFNQVYAVYILASQFAAGSIHLSVQKYVAEFFENQKKCDKIISSGLCLTFILAILVAGLIFFLREYFAVLLKSPNVSIGLIYITPGLVFFALNKILMAILNGFRLMKSYAIAQSLRYILMILFLVLAIIFHLQNAKLSLIFSGNEVCLFFWLSVVCLRRFKFVSPILWSDWTKRHLIFGYKSLLGNVLVDVNTRVDVLILGYFATDRTVGIYSFAAIFAEGFAQLLTVLKVNVNPILARLAGQKHKLKEMIKRGVKLTYQAIAVAGILAIILYPILIKLLVSETDFLTSWPIFIILITGIILGSGYLPFQMLLAQVGFPGLYTSLITITFVSNAILNIVLVPSMGMYGSALATSISVLISVVVLKIQTLKILKIKI